MPRFRVRTLMIAVAVVALLITAIGPVKHCYRRWTFHRAQAALYARFEAKERTNHARESRRSADREAIRRGLVRSPDFVAQGAERQEKMVDNGVAYHRQYAAQSLAAARGWAEKRSDCETAAAWAFDPFAPDVP